MSNGWVASIANGLALCAVVLGLASAPRAAAQTPVPYDSVEVDGAWLAYRELGEGEPLVLLHGFTSSGLAWDRAGFIEAFAPKYRVIVPDLRGRGRSIDSIGSLTELSPAQAAQDLAALLDHLEVTQVNAIGLSFGAMALLHMATSQPERFDRVVLISGGHYLRQQAREGIRRENDPENIPEQALAMMAERNGHIGGADQVRRIMEGFYASHADYRTLNFTPPLLSRITSPTLIVQGDRDVFFPMEVALEMFRSIPDGYLWVFPGEGHESFMDSHVWRERMAATFSAFLEGRIGAPGSSP